MLPPTVALKRSISATMAAHRGRRWSTRTIDGGQLALADRRRRGQRRRRHPQDPGRQRHGLGGDAVADGELGDAVPAGDRGGGASTSYQSRGAWGPVAWAMSPTTVIDPFSERRAAIRSCIGVRSCTSSMTMWP